MKLRNIPGPRMVFWMVASAALFAGSFSWYSASVMEEIQVGASAFFSQQEVPRFFTKSRAFAIEGARIFEGWNGAQATQVQILFSSEELGIAGDTATEFLNNLRTRVLEQPREQNSLALRYLTAQFDPRRARIRIPETFPFDHTLNIAFFSTRTNSHHAFVLLDHSRVIFLSKTSRDFPLEDLLGVAVETVEAMPK